ncbi:MAG: hypothetical protein JKY18_07775 [Flavobacteriales bacterium]|nr:hypothetical protein [Flavobacteriales bacterium]
MVQRIPPVQHLDLEATSVEENMSYTMVLELLCPLPDFYVVQRTILRSFHMLVHRKIIKLTQAVSVTKRQLYAVLAGGA